MSELTRGIPVTYEPKTINRFFLEFPSSVGIEVWKVQTSGRPDIDITTEDVPFINETNYVATRFKWKPISITLLDTIGPSSSQQLMEWIRLHAESLTGRMGYAAGYKKDLILKQLDPTGIPIEKWILEQCSITTAKFGDDNDMGGSSVQKISFTVQPYRCILAV